MKGLILVRPIGAGTPECESLSSYIVRLAAANCVGPKLLLHELYKSQKVPHNRGSFAGAGIASIDGPAESNDQLADIVASATGIEEVRHLTLSRFRHIVCAQKLLVSSRRWLPSGFSRLDEAHPLFERLVWRLSAFRMSPAGERLEQHCPSCRREMNVLSGQQRVGQCSHTSCKASLGVTGYHSEGYLEMEGHGTHEFWTWAAGQLGEVVAFRSELPEIGFGNAFCEWLHHYCIDSDREAAKLLATTHLSVGYWRQGRLPQLIDFLNICWCFRTSALDFIRVRLLPMEDGDGPRQSVLHNYSRQKKHRRRPVDRLNLERRLQRILTEDEYPHLSFTEICREILDRKAEVVRQYFPELAKAIALRYKVRKKLSARVLRAGRLAQIKEAATILRESGRRVTLAAIKGLLPTPSIMANNWARAAARREMCS